MKYAVYVYSTPKTGKVRLEVFRFKNLLAAKLFYSRHKADASCSLIRINSAGKQYILVGDTWFEL